MRSIRASLVLLSIVIALAPLGQAQRGSGADDPAGLLHFTLNDLPKRERNPAAVSEIAQFARQRGFDYVADTRKAALGDAVALKRFFLLVQDADGAASESISASAVPIVVFHLLGDEKFAAFLAAQSVPYRMMVRNQILSDALPPRGSLYLSHHFPRTTSLLLSREMVGWASPNGLYAIRKTFTDGLELAGSKVERAELVDKASGKTLVDLTADDIGTGAQREGEALWSPDSQRVALLSSDLSIEQGDPFATPPPTPLKKDTVVYRRSGDTFVRVDLPHEPPNRARDTELQGAILMHEFTEPVRWVAPTVLRLTRHEYYRKMMPTRVDNLVFDSIHDLARRYQITVTMRPDGSATTTWTRQP